MWRALSKTLSQVVTALEHTGGVGLLIHSVSSRLAKTAVSRRPEGIRGSQTNTPHICSRKLDGDSHNAR